MGRRAWFLLVSACTSRSTTAIDRVDPESATNLDDVALRIEGSEFLLPIHSSLDDGTTSVGGVEVTLNDQVLGGVVWRDEHLVEATVPAGIPLGAYDVAIRLGDRTDLLPAGYTAIDARVRPPAGPCGRPGAIADDFSDGVPALFWIVQGGSDVVEQSGTLAITPTSGEVGYRSNPFVDMTDAATEVEIRTMLASGSGASAYLRIEHATERYEIRQTDGTVSFGSAPSTVAIPYDPVAHRHWRIEHAGGMLGFATSPNGVAWTTQLTVTPPSWLTAATIQLGATNPAGVATGTVTFAEFNTYVPPATWCPAATLSDGFNDSTIGIEWARHGRTSGGCAETESGTAAHVDQNGTAACDAFYGSSALYTLIASQLVVRITAITNFTPGWITYIGAFDLEGRSLRLYFEQNQFCADGTNVSKVCVVYNTAEDLWRIREDAGTLFFEVASSAAGTFRIISSTATPFAPTAMRLRFGTLTDRAIMTNIGLSVDRFN